MISVKLLVEKADGCFALVKILTGKIHFVTYSDWDVKLNLLQLSTFPPSTFLRAPYGLNSIVE